MQDELKRLTELAPADETFKEELLKIRWEKILEIRHKIRCLLAAQAAEKAYEGGKEFESFLLEDIFPETKMLNIRFEKFLSDPKVQVKLNSMASVEYTPPNQFRETCIHLIDLYAYYTRLYKEKQPLSLVELVLDYSLSKLMFAAGAFLQHYLHRGRRELKRTKRSSKAQKTKAQKKREYIVKLFSYVKKKVAGNRMNLSTMAEAIRNDWKDYSPTDKDIAKPPGITFIKETLLNEEKTKGEFKKVGGLWILKM